MTEWGGIASVEAAPRGLAPHRPGAAPRGPSPDLSEAARPRGFLWPAAATALVSWAAMVAAWTAHLEAVFAVGATLAAGFGFGAAAFLFRAETRHWLGWALFAATSVLWLGLSAASGLGDWDETWAASLLPIQEQDTDQAMIVLVVGVAVVAGVLWAAGRAPRPGLALVAGLALGPTATAFLTPLAAYRPGVAPALAAACCVAAVAACLMLQGIAAGSGRALALPPSAGAWLAVLAVYHLLALAAALRWGGLEAWRSAPWFALVCLAGVALMAFGRPAGFPLLLAGGAGHALWRTCQLVFVDVEWNWGSAALPAAMVLADFAVLAVSWLLLVDPWSKSRLSAGSSLKLAAGPAAGLAAAAALIATTVDWDALVLLALFLGDLNGFVWVGDLLQIALFTGACGVPGLIAVKRWCVDGRPYQPVFGGILIAWSAVAVIWWLILTAV